MDENIDNNVAVLAILDNQCGGTLESPFKQTVNITNYSHAHTINQEETDSHETNKQNVIWTKNATLMLLNLYETKLSTLDNPKKKSKMWSTMAEELKSFNIEVTPDQVRWKINALTKKYKDCLDNGQVAGFKYYNEMHQILGKYNEDNDTYRISSGVQEQMSKDSLLSRKLPYKNGTTFRKLKMERRAKLELDKQWLQYLKRQEEHNQTRDERYERSLRLREEEIALRKKELDIKQTIALKKLQLKEKHQEEMLKIEREKCFLLRKLLGE
ncbi:uncharacterized protein LOC123691310 [Colias croceus]|uniref:uncharacterized protein LOC123691310 n=1 Tax=Colias crocea TaxID=72248 RepID=UPI001E27F1EA|nr:uncharacterized protein LOC123691310 [Colias croceus]